MKFNYEDPISYNKGSMAKIIDSRASLQFRLPLGIVTSTRVLDTTSAGLELVGGKLDEVLKTIRDSLAIRWRTQFRFRNSAFL